MQTPGGSAAATRRCRYSGRSLYTLELPRSKDRSAHSPHSHTASERRPQNTEQLRHAPAHGRLPQPLLAFPDPVTWDTASGVPGNSSVIATAAPRHHHYHPTMPLGNYHRAIAIVSPHPPEIYARKEGGSPPPPGPPPPLATGISKLSTMPDRSQKQLPLWDAPPPRRRCHPPPTGRPYACARVSVRVSVRASSLRAVLSRTIPKPRGAQREPGSETAGRLLRLRLRLCHRHRRLRLRLRPLSPSSHAE